MRGGRDGRVLRRPSSLCPIIASPTFPSLPSSGTEPGLSQRASRPAPLSSRPTELTAAAAAAAAAESLACCSPLLLLFPLLLVPPLSALPLLLGPSDTESGPSLWLEASSPALMPALEPPLPPVMPMLLSSSSRDMAPDAMASALPLVPVPASGRPVTLPRLAAPPLAASSSACSPATIPAASPARAAAPEAASPAAAVPAPACPPLKPGGAPLTPTDADTEGAGTLSPPPLSSCASAVAKCFAASE